MILAIFTFRSFAINVRASGIFVLDHIVAVFRNLIAENSISHQTSTTINNAAPNIVRLKWKKPCSDSIYKAKYCKAFKHPFSKFSHNQFLPHYLIRLLQ